MKYVNEVLKILDGALRHRPEMAARYASLLAEKLERDGDASHAAIVRERLARVSSASVGFQAAPLDRESNLSFVDMDRPAPATGLAVPEVVQARIDEFVESVFRFSELKAAGVALPPRLLLYGPPGCGKTLLARDVASRLDRPLLTVRCDTLVSSLLGQTGKNMRKVFEYADENPCVLFLDEFDALAKSRGSEGEVGELQRVVIALLQNIDALQADTIIIAATNHDELLDRAVWRRFPFTVHMPLPGLRERQRIWNSRLGAFSPGLEEVEVLAEESAGLSGAAIETACFDIVRDAVLRRTPVTLPVALRRLARVRRLFDGLQLDESDEIKALRQWNPGVFTYRALEDLFGKSARQIRNALGENANGRHDQANP